MGEERYIWVRVLMNMACLKNKYILKFVFKRTERVQVNCLRLEICYVNYAKHLGVLMANSFSI